MVRVLARFSKFLARHCFRSNQEKVRSTGLMTLSSSALESLMPLYAALNVSNDETAIHVLDETGRTVWHGKRPSDPEALATALRRHAPEPRRVGQDLGRQAFSRRLRCDWYRTRMRARGRFGMAQPKLATLSS